MRLPEKPSKYKVKQPGSCNIKQNIDEMAYMRVYSKNRTFYSKRSLC